MKKSLKARLALLAASIGLFAIPGLSQSPPNVTSILNLTFDPAQSVMVDEVGGVGYQVRNASGTTSFQTQNGNLTLIGILVEYDAYSCSPLPSCNPTNSQSGPNFEWRHFTAAFLPQTFPSPAAFINPFGSLGFNLTGLNGAANLRGGSTQPFVSGQGFFNYSGPPPVDAPLISIGYDVDFNFYSPELGTTLAVTLASNSFTTSTISQKFGNVTPAGATLWFNGNGNFKNVTAGTVINLRNQFVLINGQPYQVPDADVVFSSSATCSSTTYNSTTTRWTTTVPVAGDDEVFLWGFEVPLPMLLPKGASVTWNSVVYSNKPISYNWKWGAAAYNQLSTDYNALKVKAGDGTACGVSNGDHAGTPEAYPTAIAGGTGGGAANRTGGFSSTKSAVVSLLIPQ